MLVTTLISATLASLVAGSAIPKEAAPLVERQSGNFQCNPPSSGPYYDQVIRGIAYIQNGNSTICLPRPNACDFVSKFGTAGFRICNVVSEGSQPPCFGNGQVRNWYSTIANTCPQSDPGSIWSRVGGSYTVGASELPNGTTWAYAYLENLGATTAATAVEDA